MLVARYCRSAERKSQAFSEAQVKFIVIHGQERCQAWFPSPWKSHPRAPQIHAKVLTWPLANFLPKQAKPSLEVSKSFWFPGNRIAHLPPLMHADVHLAHQTLHIVGGTVPALCEGLPSRPHPRCSLWRVGRWASAARCGCRPAGPKSGRHAPFSTEPKAGGIF